MPLIWMFHSRGLNNKINRIHERALKITFNENHQHFKNYWLNITVTIHHRNIRALTTEIYKVLHGYSPAKSN